ncbi:MAG: formylglycine-generating enzyme family protein [Mucilaginibacter sp.]
MKKLAFLAIVVLNLVHTTLPAQDIRLQGSLKELIAGPVDPSQRDKWLDTLKQWRTIEKQKLGYNDKEYSRPQLSWINHTFMYAQIMAHDRYFYDPISGKYTVTRFLNDLEKRYGGLDAVLIWPTYPNIGVDNRNQFELVAGMPGGKEALKQMIRDFHKRGVRVFFPIMIWDKGTRKIQDHMAKALVKEMKELGADGMNGDTMEGVTRDFADAYRELNYPIALQPEVNIKDLKMVEWNRMSWGYFFPDWGVLKFNYKPGVSLYKWLEPRHQVHVTNRWAVDKTEDLQYAFFNGVGYNAWENMWGIWNQVPPRHAAAIRRIRMIYRQFPDAWSSPDWEPYIPVVQKGVFASRFPVKNGAVYTLVNRDSMPKSAVQIELPYKKGLCYYDLWSGNKLKPQRDKDKISLSFNIEARGYGAVWVSSGQGTSPFFCSFLAGINRLAKTPLNDLPDSWSAASQHITTIAPTQRQKVPPKGMVLIPATDHYDFETKGVMIEGDELPTAVGVQYPWESHPQRDHKKTMAVPAFYIDRYPVTNLQFEQFMQAAHYQPRDKHNFLKDWKNGNFPVGWANKPVTWVSLEDARAYAAWAGKRLPHEWEWQYAAQGTGGRLYPWGQQRDTTLIPPSDTTRAMRSPTDVDAYPKGASPFGVIDLTGNVWQWTDEYTDQHTRSAILKGGSYYHAQTSGWYFPQAQELNKHAKYLLMSPSIDRSATIGFRCVVDF